MSVIDTLSRDATSDPAAAAPAIRLHARPSPQYAAHLEEARAVLRQAAALGPVSQASSLGAEDVVITDLIRSLQLPITVFVLDTGRLHTETLALLERTQALPGLAVEVHRPRIDAVLDYVLRHGQDAIYESAELRKMCCAIRKLEPLERALAGQRGWITGLRQQQSSARADVPLVDGSEQAGHGRIKFNPLAHWTQGDVWHYIAEHRVDHNPLHDRFFPSIGCAPCTRAVTPGEDLRSGRWWWESESAKECGLHIKAAATPGERDGGTAQGGADARAGQAEHAGHVHHAGQAHHAGRSGHAHHTDHPTTPSLARLRRSIRP